MKIKISDFELGWLVALLEGEGHFTYNGCSQLISLAMTDEDVIRTYAVLLAKILGKNPTVLERQPAGNRKTMFTCNITGDNARTIMQLIAPFMHHRRRAKIWQSLNKYNGKPKNEDLSLSAIVAEVLKQTREQNERSAIDHGNPDGNPDDDSGPDAYPDPGHDVYSGIDP